MSRLISFDVGIKNMAYCLFDLSSNTIVEWNVLNLCEDVSVQSSSIGGNNTRVNCTSVLQNGKTCKSVAKYRKNEQCACEKHAKMSKQYFLPKKENGKTSLGKLSLVDLQDRWRETLGKTITFSQNTIPRSKSGIIKELVEYFEKTSWVLIPKPKKINAGKVDLVKLGRSLHNQMQNNDNMKTVEYVIIENQISPIANRMKTLQGMLTQHFISLGVPYIEFISSSNKLKDLIPQSTAKTSYKQNKQNSIIHCTTLLKEEIQNSESWISHFQGSSKKDDLADSFLQGLWWRKKNKK